MSNNVLWDQVLTKCKLEVTGVTYKTFIEPIILRNIEENPYIVYLELEDDKQFFVEILKRRYLHLFENAFKEITGNDYRVIIKIKSEYNENNKVEISHIEKSKAYNIDNSSFKSEKIFNPKYTFDNFVVGESNKFAYAACRAVANSPSQAYNPLFIHGKSGLGKTHLMNAIGIHILENTKNLNILYVTSEDFTNECIKAIQYKKTREFQYKYRNTDILLIDDIQFLEGKENMQLEFFNTFNALHDSNKQIIISSDRPPHKLTELDERLRSRFGWNMIAEIESPDYETRVAILMKKAENMDVEVTDEIYDIMCLISKRIKNNIRELEGAFTRVVSFSRIMGEQINMEFAERVLTDIIQNGSSSITPEKIKNSVCKYYKIKISDLESETRKAHIAYPRQIAMYLCREMTDYSLNKIGNLFGGKHYTTVKHACEKIRDDIEADSNFKETIEELKKSVNNN